MLFFPAARGGSTVSTATAPYISRHETSVHLYCILYPQRNKEGRHSRSKSAYYMSIIFINSGHWSARCYRVAPELYAFLSGGGVSGASGVSGPARLWPDV